MEASQRGVLYLIACGSAAAWDVVEPGVQTAQAAGWDVCVITTPNGKQFINMPLLARLTGHPVRSEYKVPDTPDLLPPANALLVYPATFKTINTWAAGDSSTLAVGLLCEYLGLGAPIVAVPCLGMGNGLHKHPVFVENLEKLKRWGVHVLYEPESYPPRNAVPAAVVLEALHQLIAGRQCQDEEKSQGI